MPIRVSPIGFRADTNAVNPLTGEYKDPLMRWPLRGAAFTNEVGEALRPLIGDYATLSWVPALLYIGADIYDKYKNDQNEYSPDSRRCLKQAVFQGMASIALPLVAVKAGQNLFSLYGKLTKDKLTLNTKEHIIKLAQEFVANGKMHAYENKDDECIKEFMNIVTSNIDLSDNKFLKHHYSKNKSNTEKYAGDLIKEIIKLRKDLISPPQLFENSLVYSNYKELLNKGQTQNVAVKTILNTFLQNKTLKGKTVKTLGGFVALGLSITPIDHFVENVLIGKVVGPEIDKKRTA